MPKTGDTAGVRDELLMEFFLDLSNPHYWTEKSVIGMGITEETLPKTRSGCGWA